MLRNIFLVPKTGVVAAESGLPKDTHTCFRPATSPTPRAPPPGPQEASKRLPEGFRVEVGRANYTTMERLVASGTIKRETHDAIKAYLQPYNAALDQMFPSTKFW